MTMAWSVARRRAAKARQRLVPTIRRSGTLRSADQNAGGTESMDGPLPRTRATWPAGGCLLVWGMESVLDGK